MLVTLDATHDAYFVCIGLLYHLFGKELWQGQGNQPASLYRALPKLRIRRTTPPRFDIWQSLENILSTRGRAMNDDGYAQDCLLPSTGVKKQMLAQSLSARARLHPLHRFCFNRFCSKRIMRHCWDQVSGKRIILL